MKGKKTLKDVSKFVKRQVKFVDKVSRETINQCHFRKMAIKNHQCRD